MKFWQALSFSEPEQLVEIAKIAEEVGFEGVLVSDHLVHSEKMESKYPYSESGEPDFSAATPWPECWLSIVAALMVWRHEVARSSAARRNTALRSAHDQRPHSFAASAAA